MSLSVLVMSVLYSYTFCSRFFLEATVRTFSLAGHTILKIGKRRIYCNIILVYSRAIFLFLRPTLPYALSLKPRNLNPRDNTLWDINRLFVIAHPIGKPRDYSSKPGLYYRPKLFRLIENSQECRYLLNIAVMCIHTCNTIITCMPLDKCPISRTFKIDEYILVAMTALSLCKHIWLRLKQHICVRLRHIISGHII